MKRSKLKQSIKEEIFDILEAATVDDVKAQKDYNDELAKTAKLAKDAGLMDEGNDSDKFQDDGYVDHKYNDSTIDKYNIPVEPTAVFEEPEFGPGRLKKAKSAMDKAVSEIMVKLKEYDEDEEPTASQLKKEPISKIGYKLADTQKEMKKVVKKWKDAEGSEKVKLTDRLRELTKIKKELESLLQ